MDYRNRLGVAGGVDKNARIVTPLFKLGFGFVEIGTITPEPQGPNPGKILDRNWEKKALWNKMGFPNIGAQNIAKRLQNLSSRLGPIWINIGKNRNTNIDEAHRDYETCARILDPYADAFVVNISSPNTAQLRELQSTYYLRSLLKPLRLVTKRPLLLKLSPDQNDADLRRVIEEAVDLGVNGMILTNTTLSREAGLAWPSEGGVSGAPLRVLSQRALEVATQVRSKLKSNIILVSAGGIMTPQDVKLRIEIGADLVQVYSALVFEGFSFAQNVAEYFHAEKT